MYTTYAQKQSPAQKKDAPSASSILDNSSQSEFLQRKADMVNNAAQRTETPRPNNTGMPDDLKSGIESLSGFSMDNVRVHYNSSKPATVQALAYTQGTDIHVAPGQEKHLPHEAWHVAQQMAGRVSPTTNINGMPVNDNAALEHEADVMGEKAVTQMLSTGVEKYHNIGKYAIAQGTFQKKIFSNNNNVQRVAINAKNDPYNSSFKNTIEYALQQIENTYCVSAIRKTKKNKNSNWTDILICNNYNGGGCGFENGCLIDGDNLLLYMDIGQCENMYWGEMNDSIEKGNSGITVTLLHELGHAYQYYLNLDSFEVDDNRKKKNKFRQKINLASTLKNMQIQENFPDLFNWMKQINENEIDESSNETLRKLINAANTYCKESVSDITSQLLLYLSPDSEQRKEQQENKESLVDELMNKICDKIIKESDNQDLSDLTQYPLLFECISQIYEEKFEKEKNQIADEALRKLINAAKSYYGESVSDITSQLSLYLSLDSEQRKENKEIKNLCVKNLCDKIKVTLGSMASNAENRIADADNLFMNEIPFATEYNCKKENKEKIGIRKLYGDATDIRDYKLNKLLEDSKFGNLKNFKRTQECFNCIKKKFENESNYYLSTPKPIWEFCAGYELLYTLDKVNSDEFSDEIIKVDDVKNKLKEKNRLIITDLFFHIFEKTSSSMISSWINNIPLTKATLDIIIKSSEKISKSDISKQLNLRNIHFQPSKLGDVLNRLIRKKLIIQSSGFYAKQDESKNDFQESSIVENQQHSLL